MRIPDLRTILVVGIVLTVLCIPASAHSPSNLVLSYDPAKGELQATLTHRVEDPATHYVRSVSVEEDGGPMLRVTEYTDQPSHDIFTYSYPLPIAPGTRVRVTGECNVAGEIQRDLVIGGEATPAATTPSGAVTPRIAGFTLVAVCMALAVAGVTAPRIRRLAGAEQSCMNCDRPDCAREGRGEK